MAPKVIVSYDGTPNDDDALALGAVFREAGAELALAYVRHFPEDDPDRERLAELGARRVLERGAGFLGTPDISQHIVLSGATGAGLGQLAERTQADVIVFGSDYRTAPGHVEPGTSAQRLLEGGPAAIAIAPAGARDQGELSIGRIAVADEDADPSARQTAESLSRSLGAVVVVAADDRADLLVVGSRPDAPPGRVLISARAAYRIETSRSPALVVPRARAVEFGRAAVAQAV